MSPWVRIALDAAVGGAGGLLAARFTAPSRRRHRGEHRPWWQRTRRTSEDVTRPLPRIEP